MNLAESTRHAVRELLRQQQLGVLSTVGGDAPYANLVAFTVSADDGHLFFVTPRATRKFANISANTRVALLVNNSMNRPEDFHKAAAVTAIGAASPVAASQREAVRKDYLTRHPYLTAFVDSPSSELVDIRVARYILVERFQNVTEYRIDHDMDRTP